MVNGDTMLVTVLLLHKIPKNAAVIFKLSSLTLLINQARALQLCAP